LATNDDQAAEAGISKEMILAVGKSKKKKKKKKQSMTFNGGSNHVITGVPL